jgi:hypothetical protein
MISRRRFLQSLSAAVASAALPTQAITFLADKFSPVEAQAFVDMSQAEQAMHLKTFNDVLHDHLSQQLITERLLHRGHLFGMVAGDYNKWYSGTISFPFKAGK